MEGYDGEVVNREFLDEAGIEVATPWRDGVEAERASFDHAGCEGGGLSIAVAFSDGMAETVNKQQEHYK